MSTTMSSEREFLRSMVENAKTSGATKVCREHGPLPPGAVFCEICDLSGERVDGRDLGGLILLVGVAFAFAFALTVVLIGIL